MSRGLGAILLLLAASAACAHPLAPALLDLCEIAPERYTLLWRTSVARTRGTEVVPRWPESCSAQPAGDAQLEDNEALVQRWLLECPGGLAGRSLGVSGLERSGINVILRLEPQRGAAVQTLLDAGQPQFTVPPPGEATPVFARYLGLGVEHLLLGPDHLLFVLGLLLLVRGLRALSITVTAFTLGHSLTLSLAALGLVRVNPALTELAIAASLLLLAGAALRAPGTAPSVLARRPWTMALVFGLVHGLGFAGALAQIGLPQRELPLALFGFNLGIELGQLLVIGIVLAARALSAKAGSGAAAAPVRVPLRTLAAYAIGVPAAAWCFERGAALLA